jgi:hypothetical protein
MIVHSVLCALLAAWAAYGHPGAKPEDFEEDLVIRPLKDGRIGARFAFTTTLKDTSPRNPESLGRDDDCTSTRFRAKMGRTLIDPGTQPSTIPFSPSLWGRSFGNMQSRNYICP